MNEKITKEIESNKQYLEELTKWTLRRTNNLKVIDKDIFADRTESLMVFRLLMKLSQRKFSKLIGISKGHLWNLEAGKLKSTYKSKELSEKLNPLFRKFTLPKNTAEELFKTYKEFKMNFHLDSKRAKQIRKNVCPYKNLEKGIISRSKNLPENEFESKIFDILTKANVQFETHGVFELGRKKLIVDFVIPNMENPEFVIEVKQTQTKNSRRLYDALHYQAIVIDHRMRFIKKYYPNVKAIAIMSSKNIPFNNLSPIIEMEFLDTDAYFIDSTLDNLIKYLKKK